MFDKTCFSHLRSTKMQTNLQNMIRFVVDRCRESFQPPGLLVCLSRSHVFDLVETSIAVLFLYFFIPDNNDLRVITLKNSSD